MALFAGPLSSSYWKCLDIEIGAGERGCVVLTLTGSGVHLQGSPITEIGFQCILGARLLRVCQTVIPLTGFIEAVFWDLLHFNLASRILHLQKCFPAQYPCQSQGTQSRPR